MQHKKRFLFLAALLIVLFTFAAPKVYAATTLPANEKTIIKFKQAQQTKKVAFTMPEDGYVQFLIAPKDLKLAYSNDPIANWAYWSCSVKYHGNISEKGGFSVDKRSSSNYKWVTRKTGLYSLGKGEKMFLTITSSNRDFGYVNKISVYAKVSTPKNFEIEKNDSKNKATPIKYKKKNTGIVSGQEGDWWVFTAPKSKNYSFEFLINNDKLSNQYFLTNNFTSSPSSKGDSCTYEVYDSSLKKLSSKTIRDYNGTVVYGPCKLKKNEKYYIHMLRNSAISRQAMYNIKVK